ncbi:MAG: protein kinase [Polyangiales bacterium]
MGLPRDRVLADGHTPHPWERQAVEFIKSALPNENPYVLWALVELVEPSGRRHEIDALVLGHNALYLVEVKSHPAHFSGNGVNWTYTFVDDHRSHIMECPMTGAGRKARALASLLQKRFSGRRPRVEPLVFLAHEKADVSGLDAQGRAGVVTRKTFARAITQGQFEGAMSSLQDRVIDPATAKETIRALQSLGIVESKGHRKLGDLTIGEVIDESLDPQSGYQDHLGRNESLDGLVRRVRVYLVAHSSTPERQDQLRRAATREARILTALSHPNVLQCVDFKADGPTGGPCLVFEHDPAFERLDRYLQQRPKLPFADRMAIARQVGEAVAYCHGRKVLHRGIDPTAVLVRGGEGAPVETRLFNFQLAQHVDHAGTVHLSAFSDLSLYRAPELLDAPQQADAQSDVFSLGALAWFVFVGRPPAASLAERQRLLDRDRKLSLANAGEELAGLELSRRGQARRHRTLNDVIEFATEVSRAARCESAAGFVDLLGHVQVGEVDDDAPLREAVSGDELRADDGTVLLVEKVLGTGSTAKVFRVIGDAVSGALKVALEPEFEERLEAEGRLLERARGDRIVGLERILRIRSQWALLLEDAGETLAAKLGTSGAVGLDQARRWGDDLLRAVERLEEFGVVHKDIKPANIGFVQRDPRGPQHLMLFDFSLASAGEADVLVGTPLYRDPGLLLRGRWDAAADRWSAAVTLYEMLTGHAPRWADDVTLGPDAEVVLEPERFDPSVRDALTAFFKRCFARELAGRFDGAGAMREAWVVAFVPRGVAAVAPVSAVEPERAAAPKPTWPGDALARIRDATPVEALPLSNRARNALDRNEILTFGALRRVSHTQLSQLRGVGRETTRELLAFREAWRNAQSVEPPPPGPASPPTAHDEPAAPTSVSAWLAAFIPARRRGARVKAWVDYARARFGLDGEPPMDGAALARSRGVSRQAVFIHASEARGVWRATPLLGQLQLRVAESLGALDGVAPVPLVAEAVARRCGAPAAEALDAATRAEAEALVEVARATDDGLVDAVIGDVRWVASDRALVDAARRLGAEADALAARDVLPSAEEASERLRGLAEGGDLARLGVERLLPLAARASAGAACSARLELYPRAMPAERALRLCAGVFTDAAYDEARLRNVVASRYAEALPLPERPALDALVEQVLGFRFDPVANHYARAPVADPLSSATQAPSARRTPVVRALAGVGPPRAVQLDDPGARDFDERLRVAAQRRAFRVINVALPDATAAAHAVARRLGAPVQSVDRALWQSLRALAERDGVDWSVVVEADRAGPRGEDWETLRALVRDAASALLDRWRADNRTLVLCDLGLCARFGLRELVDGVAELARRDDGPAVFVVLACRQQEGDAPIDGGELPGLALPNPTAAPRLIAPSAWIKALAA